MAVAVSVTVPLLPLPPKMLSMAVAASVRLTARAYVAVGASVGLVVSATAAPRMTVADGASVAVTASANPRIAGNRVGDGQLVTDHQWRYKPIDRGTRHGIGGSHGFGDTGGRSNKDRIQRIGRGIGFAQPGRGGDTGAERGMKLSVVQVHSKIAAGLGMSMRARMYRASTRCGHSP